MVSPTAPKVDYKIENKSSAVSRLEIISLDVRKPSLINRFIKRSFDLLTSLVAILILSPIFIIISLAIKLSDRGPIFFMQERVGLNGKIFRMIKFRSMVVDAEEKLNDLQSENEMPCGILFKIKKDPRVTRVGKFIRKFSLDELPQLFNVFLGSMSIVGPRPALQSEVDKYEVHHLARLKVKQGLTCYWQCSGRSSLSFEQQMELDIKYVKNNNIFIDIWIIIRTIPTVIFGRGV